MSGAFVLPSGTCGVSRIDSAEAYLGAVTLSAAVTLGALYGLFRADPVAFVGELADAPVGAVASSPVVVGLAGLVVAGLAGLFGSVVVLGARAAESRDR